MLDPLASDPIAMGPSPAAAIRAVSDRLAEQRSTWDHSQSPPSRPAWPISSSVGKLQPAETKIGLGPKLVTASTNPIELSPSVLAQPNPAAGESFPIATETAGVSPTKEGLAAVRSSDSQAASLAGGQAARPSSVGSPEVIPQVPGTAPEFGGSGAKSTRNHAASPVALHAAEPQIVGQAGGGMAPSVASSPGFVSSTASSGGRSNVDPASKGGASVEGSPGVPGRMPAAMSSLAMASPGVSDGGVMGMGNGSFDVGDGNGLRFDSTAAAGSGGATMDLSKTNELLQQLVDAVRKQLDTNGTPLPTGGPSVYAERF